MNFPHQIVIQYESKVQNGLILKVYSELSYFEIVLILNASKISFNEPFYAQKNISAISIFKILTTYSESLKFDRFQTLNNCSVS